MKSPRARAHFLNRYPVDITPTRDGAWRSTLNAISAAGATPHAAVDALRELCAAPVCRLPVSVARWITAR